MIGFLCFAATLAALWMIYRKLGREGWEGIIPLYSSYVLCEVLYGSGLRALLLLVPFYNIYFLIKMNINLAKGFGKSAGYGIGMTFLPFIFKLILGFGDAVYGDGTAANTKEDAVTAATAAVTEKAKELTFALSRDRNALEKLSALDDLRKKGVLTEEEYAEKKAELMKRV